MKCKCVLFNRNKDGGLRLIEAYWNVNIDNYVAAKPHPSGLIEAYWNVNNLQQVPRNKQVRFNRSILKCKYRAVALHDDTRSGLIEAYWNVNVYTYEVDIAVLPGLIEAYWNVNDVRRSSRKARSQV